MRAHRRGAAHNRKGSKSQDWLHEAFLHEHFCEFCLVVSLAMLMTMCASEILGAQERLGSVPHLHSHWMILKTNAAFLPSNSNSTSCSIMYDCALNQCSLRHVRSSISFCQCQNTTIHFRRSHYNRHTRTFCAQQPHCPVRKLPPC